MDNDDEILTSLMKNDSEYIMDDGFSQRVVGKLPRRRMSASWRRTVLVLGAALVGCTCAGILSGPGIVELSAKLASVAQRHANIFSGAYAPYVYMAGALIVGLATAWFVSGKNVLTDRI